MAKFYSSFFIASPGCEKDGMYHTEVKCFCIKYFLLNIPKD